MVAVLGPNDALPYHIHTYIAGTSALVTVIVICKSKHKVCNVFILYIPVIGCGDP
jgi:hypothetical protein